MKNILFTLLALFGLLGVAGCDMSTNDTPSSANDATSSYGILKGHIYLGNGSGSTSSNGATAIQVCMNGTCGSVASDGSYSVNTQAKLKAVAARTTASDSLLGTAFIVSNGDTLKEIPVTSWNLPSGYMVQRNVTIAAGSNYVGDTAQLVYWDNDSIAYVVNVDYDEGSSANQYTGFIYSYYDSASYVNNSTLFSYFARTISHDTLKAYSDVFNLHARAGNFTVDSGKFHSITYSRKGYSLVPALDTVTRWIDSSKLSYDNSWVMPDSQHEFAQYKTMAWFVNDSVHWDKLLLNVDTLKIAFKINAPNKALDATHSNEYTLYVGRYGVAEFSINNGKVTIGNISNSDGVVLGKVVNFNDSTIKLLMNTASVGNIWCAFPQTTYQLNLLTKQDENLDSTYYLTNEKISYHIKL